MQLIGKSKALLRKRVIPMSRFSNFFIQTKNKPHRSIYHAKWGKYVRFHKNPLQTFEISDPLIRGTLAPQAYVSLLGSYIFCFLQRILIKLRRFCKFGMITCTMDAIFCVSVKMVDFVLVKRKKREKGQFPAVCSLGFGGKHHRNPRTILFVVWPLPWRRPVSVETSSRCNPRPFFDTGSLWSCWYPCLIEIPTFI